VSEYIRRLLIEDGIAPARVETIYTGIDIDRFKPRPRMNSVAGDLNISEDELVVGCVSSLHVRKGIEEVLKAFKLLQESMPERKIRCLLVGKKWERWAALATELGIREQVTFTGFRRDVADLLSVLDIYVLPSRDEGLGTSILEAMAMGLPVVVSNVGGIPEAVTGQSGVIVPPRDPNRLAEALKTLLRDNQQRETLGTIASERVGAEFSVERLIDRTLNLYERLMETG